MKMVDEIEFFNSQEGTAIQVGLISFLHRNCEKLLVSIRCSDKTQTLHV